MRSIRTLPLCTMLCAFLAGSFVLLTGCALTPSATSSRNDAVSFGGSVIGGENPVSGATVSFYETAPTGYSTESTSSSHTANDGVYVPLGALTPIGSTTSDINGNFGFATTLACTSSSDYVYAVAAGGNSGANASNTDILLMAAVGNCGSLSAAPFVTINELTSVAAAYALSGFTTVLGTYTTKNGTADSATAYSITSNVATITAANTLVSGQTVALSAFTVGTFFNGNSYQVISATATAFTFAISQANTVGTVATTGTATEIKANTVPSVSVTASTTNYATASAASTPSAAGLAHAFANAANLVNITTGYAYNVLPGNATTMVPAGLINTLGNVLQACVNSLGGAATSSAVNDGTACGKLFSYTTNPVTPSSPPSNTLSALLDIARFPTQNVGQLYGLGVSYHPYSSGLVSAPQDWSIGIAYKSTDGAITTGQGLGYPYHLTLDIKDNVYVSNPNASTATSSDVVAFSSSGTVLWDSPADTVDLSPRFIAADALGNIFQVNNGSVPYSAGPPVVNSTENIIEFLASNGSVEQTIATGYQYPYGIAIDQNSNLWVSTSTGTAGAQNVYEYLCSTTGTNCNGGVYTPASLGITPSGADAASTYAYQPVIDTSNNIWVSNYHSSSVGSPFVIPYTGYQAGPPAINPYDVAETTASPAVPVTATYQYGMTVDSAGNGWISTAPGFVKLTAGGAGYSFSLNAGSIIPYTPTGGTSSLRFLNIDGNNTIWSVDNNGVYSAVVGYRTTGASPVVFRLAPCMATYNGACPNLSATTQGVYGPRVAQVDSTGSIWVVNSTNGSVVQIIGAAAPTWPLLSLIKPGIMP